LSVAPWHSAGGMEDDEVTGESLPYGLYGYVRFDGKYTPLELEPYGVCVGAGLGAVPGPTGDGP